MRSDVQYLRAIAVIGVVLYHLWPNRIPGGYVGVDVFFVISGFLITLHLLKEMSATKTLSLKQFYSRRARRILPASLTVLVLTIIATLVFSPLQDWSNSFRQIFASTLFFQNWQLAYDQVDYLTAEAAPTPVQQFWSLSVEEQFYLFWPLLVLVTFLTFSRRKEFPAIKFGLVFGLIGLLSFAYSVWLTEFDPVQAYFSTGTRIWELIVGALLALLPKTVEKFAALRQFMAVIGWLAITGSMFLFTVQTPFPSFWAAIPVLGTALVIWANTNRERKNQFYSFAERPILFTAELSFSIYLYHWPILIFAQQFLEGDLSREAKVAVIVLSFVLAWVTTKFIENPIRFGTVSKLPPQKQLALAVIAIMAVALTAGVARVIVDRFSSQQAASAIGLEVDDCFGALSKLPGNNCADAVFPKLTPSPELAFRDKPEVTTGSKCGASQDQTELFSCLFGNPSSETKVALIGDSHAMSIFPAIERLAIDQDWSLTTYLRGACPFLGLPLEGNLSQRAINCNNWNRDIVQELGEVEPFDIVIVTNNDARRGYSVAAVVAAWQPLVDRGSKVVVIRGVPNMVGALDCMIRNPDDPSACEIDRESALANTRMLEAAKLVSGTVVVDLSDYFCDSVSCKVAIAGATAFRDNHHLTNTFAATLFRPIKFSLEQQNILTPSQ